MTTQTVQTLLNRSNNNAYSYTTSTIFDDEDV